MRSSFAVGCVVGGMAIAASGSVSAEESAAEDEAPPEGTMLAPNRALELQFNAGYTQPFGHFARGLDARDVASAGFVGGGALALRLTPRFALTGYGSFHHSAPGDQLDGGMVFGGTGGVGANIHLRPYAWVDPYFDVGAGYRLLFIAPDGAADNHMLHGFEALKASFGVDFRISESFALGPMIGADVNVLLWDFNETRGSNDAIRRDGVSTFLFAGVAGKLDLMGTRVAKPGPRPAAMPLPLRTY